VPWFVAAAGLLLAGSFLGDTSITGGALAAIMGVPVRPEASGPFGFATCCSVQGLAQIGQTKAAQFLLRRAEAMEHGADLDPVFVLWLRLSRGYLDLLAGKVGDSIDRIGEALALGKRHEAAIGRALSSVFLAQSLFEISDIDRLEELARDTFEFGERSGLRTVIDWTTHFLSMTRTAVGRHAEALGPLRALLDRPEHRLVTAARSALVASLLEVGDLRAAAREAEIAVHDALFPTGRAGALASAAFVELALGRAARALEMAELGLAISEGGGNPFCIRSLRLVRAEAKHALGDVAGARTYMLGIADSLHEPRQRRDYLGGVLPNLRIAERAREWAGE